MVGKVKAAVDPNAVLRHVDVFLRTNRPGAFHWHHLALCYDVSCRCGYRVTARMRSPPLRSGGAAE